VKTLHELLALAESFGMLVGWMDEDALELHWRCLTGQTEQTEQTEQTGPRMNHVQHAPHSPLLPFGRPLVALAVAAPAAHLSGYLVLNREVWEREACQSTSSLYETIAAVSMAINHARQFIASFAEGSIERGKDLSPLSQVVVFTRGGRFYLEPHKETLS
jgi:hypothetical protein